MAGLDTERKPLLDDLPPEKEDHKDYAEKARPTGCRGVIRRALLGDSNPDFAFNAEIAIRGAVFVTILGLPFILPTGYIVILDRVMEHGLYGVGCITFFIFNYSPYLGDVLSTCCYGLRGTSLAVLNTWLMFAIFPQGVTENGPWYVVAAGLANGAIFMSCMFFFNFSISTTIFTVSNFVFFWMSFMDTAEEAWALPGSANFKWKDDQGVHALFTLFVGGCLACAGTLLPYPMFALDGAKEVAEELTAEMPRVLRLIVEYYSEDSPNVYARDRVHRRLDRLESIAPKLQKCTASSWWECFLSPYGAGNSSRRMLTELDSRIQLIYDRIKGTWAVARGQTAWEQAHVQLMKAIKPATLNCINSCETLVGTCMSISSVGIMDDAGAAVVERQRKALKEATDALAKDFRDTRDKMAKEDKRSTSQFCLEELLVSHMVCANLFAYVRHSDGFAEALLQHKINPAATKLPIAHAAAGFQNIFEIDKDGVMFALRGVIGVFIALAVGYYGHGELILFWDANIACVVVVMQSRHLGSMITKNLGRLQGVVLGCILGEIVQSVVPTCEWWSLTLRITCVFGYAMMTLFIYHSSSQFGYLGMLLSAFGITKMLKTPCILKVEGDLIDMTGDYRSLIDTVIAVSLITVIDLVLSSSSAADKAFTASMRTLDVMEETVTQAFDKSVTSLKFHKAGLKASIANAEVMGAEAATEPRYHRTPWKTQTYDEMTQLFGQLRFAFTALEYSLVESGRDAEPKNHVAKALESLPEWSALGRLMAAKMATVKKLIPVVAHEKVTRFPPFADPDVTTSLGKDIQEMHTKLVHNVAGISDKVKAGSSLEEDPLVQLCMVMGACAAIFEGLRALQHTLLRTA